MKLIATLFWLVTATWLFNDIAQAFLQAACDFKSTVNATAVAACIGTLLVVLLLFTTTPAMSIVGLLMSELTKMLLLARKARRLLAATPGGRMG